MDCEIHRDDENGSINDSPERRMTSALGIHHITMITRKVQANVDFYAGFLGLRLVKRTAGFEDAMQLHLL